MKRINFNKRMLIVLSSIVALAILILGKGSGTEHAAEVLSIVPAVSLTDAEKAGLSEPEQKFMLACKKMAYEAAEKMKEGAISKEEMHNFVNGMKESLTNSELKAMSDQLNDLKSKAAAQGTSLEEINLKLQNGSLTSKSIAETLKEHEAEFKQIYSRGQGIAYFQIHQNKEGKLVASKFDPTNKAAGPNATIGGIGAGNVASVTQSINAQALLRLGANAPIIGQYRDTAWVFDLCNTQTVGADMPFAIWYEEQAKDGASANTTEGSTRPKVQYKYVRKSTDFKKESALLQFTDEFHMDFIGLENDIMNKGRIDLINRINSGVLTNVISAATAYNTATSFKAGTVVANANDFDVLAALAAQVDNSTFGSLANAALMSTFKKYRMGSAKDTTGQNIARPDILSNLAFVSNPALTADQVLVGDFKQYNIQLRGGMILKVGYNGTDFAEGAFSVVMDQFYYDWISTIRAAAIVKGPDFATVKTAISA